MPRESNGGLLHSGNLLQTAVLLLVCGGGSLANFHQTAATGDTIVARVSVLEYRIAALECAQAGRNCPPGAQAQLAQSTPFRQP